MSYRRFVAPVLEALPEGTFEVVVTGDAVTRGKPHPEPYQKAAAILGVDPSDTIAIEDETLEVIATPGHTAEHVCFLTSAGDLFTGDTVLGEGATAIFPPDGSMRYCRLACRRDMSA